MLLWLATSPKPFWMLSRKSASKDCSATWVEFHQQGVVGRSSRPLRQNKQPIISNGPMNPVLRREKKQKISKSHIEGRRKLTSVLVTPCLAPLCLIQAIILISARSQAIGMISGCADRGRWMRGGVRRPTSKHLSNYLVPGARANSHHATLA
jgi:hypothetical protein